MKRIIPLLFVLSFSSIFAADAPMSILTLAERQKGFQQILSKSKTDEAKIRVAEKLALDKTSLYRVEAINYLIDQNSLSSGPMMATLVKDNDVQDFAIYGVGVLGVYEATPLLIEGLQHDNRNTRGNAFRALQKLYPKDFNFQFQHDDPIDQRQEVVKNIETWWKNNQESLKSASLQKKSEKERKEAQLRWEKYGKEYLSRPAK